MRGPIRPFATMACLAVVLTACSGTDADPAASSTTTSSTTTSSTSTLPPVTADPATTAQIERDATAAVEELSVLAFQEVADAMGASGDRRWLPYLVDMRLVNASVWTSARAAMALVTGVADPGDPRRAYSVYGTILYDTEPDPGEHYLEWKASLSPRHAAGFGDLLRQVTDPVVAGQIQWGGVLVGGIVALVDQPTLSVAAADYMTDEELTFGAVIEGEARSYPHRIMDHHELANDVLGGEPVALINCTLCRTGILYSRRVGEKILDFRTSGLLWNSNKVMVDDQTSSLWFQLTGEAFAGPLSGTVLDRLPVVVTTYGDWVAAHPETDVMSIPTAFGYSYQPGDAYASYYASEELIFPSASVPDVFPLKTEMATLSIGGARLAVEVAALVASGPQEFDVGGVAVVAVPSAFGARFYEVPSDRVGGAAEAVAGATITEDALVVEGASWPRVLSGQSFWFAWHSNFPDTMWWPES